MRSLPARRRSRRSYLLSPRVQAAGSLRLLEGRGDAGRTRPGPRRDQRHHERARLGDAIQQVDDTISTGGPPTVSVMSTRSIRFANVPVARPALPNASTLT